MKDDLVPKVIEESYFDQCGNEIKEGDLLQIFHYHSYKRTNEFMHHIVVLQESQGKYWWAAKSYYQPSDKGHYWLKSVGGKDRVIKGCTVIDRNGKLHADYSILRKYKMRSEKRISDTKPDKT